MTRAALYARVSTSEQDPTFQLLELRDVAEQRGWAVAGEWVDVASGASAERAALGQLLERCRRGQVDVVAIWRLDRLARSVPHLLQLGQDLRRWGVDLVSLRDGAIDTTSPTGEFFFAVLAAVAALERGVIRERAIEGQQLARARGVHCGRPLAPLTAEAARAALEEHGSERRAAEALGVSRGVLRRRLCGGSKAPPVGAAKNAVSTVT